MMALQTSPCNKTHRSEARPRGGRKTELGEEGKQPGQLTMPRTEESKLTSQRRRSSPALRMTGRDPERPRFAAIDDMSMAAGASEGRGSVLGLGNGSGRRIWAFWRGQIVAIWAVSGPFWRAREMAGGWDCSLSRLTCLKYFFFSLTWGWRAWCDGLKHRAICSVLVAYQDKDILTPFLFSILYFIQLIQQN